MLTKYAKVRLFWACYAGWDDPRVFGMGHLWAIYCHDVRCKEGDPLWMPTTEQNAAMWE